MLAKKDIPASAPIPPYVKELEYLYGRRLIIDTLIDSLEQYDRYRAMAADENQLKLA